MSLIIIAFHHPECTGIPGDERCYGFVAHAETIDEALQHAFDGGIDIDSQWRIRATPPIPDRWIDPSYYERVLTDDECSSIPEPREFAQYENRYNN